MLIVAKTEQDVCVRCTFTTFIYLHKTYIYCTCMTSVHVVARNRRGHRTDHRALQSHWKHDARVHEDNHSPTHSFPRKISGWWNSSKGRSCSSSCHVLSSGCLRRKPGINSGKRISSSTQGRLEGLWPKKKLFLTTQHAFTNCLTSTDQKKG